MADMSIVKSDPMLALDSLYTVRNLVSVTMQHARPDPK
jgi:hypothetical protein